MDLIKELKRVSLFSDVSDESLRLISNTIHKRTYAKDDVVISKGDLGSELCIVHDGSFRAVLIDDDGKEVILSRFGLYDIFGEFSVIDSKERAGTIIADVDSSTFIIDNNSFFCLLRAEPDVAISLLKMLVARLRRADELIESLMFLNVRDRILSYLKAKI